MSKAGIPLLVNKLKKVRRQTLIDTTVSVEILCVHTCMYAFISITTNMNLT